jgi:hypothetical protein
MGWAEHTARLVWHEKCVRNFGREISRETREDNIRMDLRAVRGMWIERLEDKVQWRCVMNTLMVVV